MKAASNPFYADPLVSVVVTTRDDEAGVLHAVRSLLDQTWRALEVVVVDDASSDRTVEELATVNDPRLKVWRTPTRIGAEACQALGIGLCRGELVAFQRGADQSDPRRVDRQARLLLEHANLRSCTCGAVRVDGRGRTPIDAPSALSAMVWRSELEQPGLHERVWSARTGDFAQRATAAFGASAVAHIDEPLYLEAATTDDPGAPGDPVQAPGGQPPSLQRVPTAGQRRTASMATIASRSTAFRQVVQRILPQVDELRVYLNDYDEIPPHLRHDRITAFLGRKHAGDLADNGKFYRVESLVGYHFTIDDDIRYPDDYIATLQDAVDRYGGQAVVGVHGITIDYARFKHYYDPDSRTLHPYQRALGTDTAVHLLGTGTVGYHTSALPLEPGAFTERFMADLFFGIQAQRSRVPMVCIARPDGWLQDHQVPGDTRIFTAQAGKDQLQSKLVIDAALVAHRPRGLLAPPPESPVPATPAPARQESTAQRSPFALLDLRAQQSAETIGLLAAALCDRTVLAAGAQLADLRYRPGEMSLGPFESEDAARAVIASLGAAAGVDAELVDAQGATEGFFVRASGLGTNEAATALKNRLARSHTRGDRFLRLGPFPGHDVALGVVHTLSEDLDALGWVVPDLPDPDATYFVTGFGLTNDTEGTWVETHLAPRPRAAGGSGTARAEAGILPFTDEEVAAERQRLIRAGHRASAVDRPDRALRSFARAHAIRALEQDDLQAMGLCLVRTNSAAAGLELLAQAALSAPDLAAAAARLERALEGRSVQHRTEIYAALVGGRPEALVYRASLAELLHEQGRPEEALALFDRRSEGSDTRAWERAAASTALRAGRIGRALGHLIRSLVAPSGALATAQGAQLTDSEAAPHAEAQPASGAGAPPQGPADGEAAPLLLELTDVRRALDASDADRRALRRQVAELETRLSGPDGSSGGAASASNLLGLAQLARTADPGSREAVIDLGSQLDVLRALRRADRDALGAVHTPDGGASAASLRATRVACILDEFSHASYRDECNALQLTPQHWRRELEDFAPELLFVESAWRGKDDLWGSKVGHKSQELVGIVAWCRAHGVPTVFWNKEDPVHFGTFLSTAELFDTVFTTDIDCIHRYKRALGHDRVYLLHFACQPKTTNPIETWDRSDAFCFAGAYYVRYPERTRDLGNFVDALAAYRPVEIYDRNFGKRDPNYQFPPEYQPYIVGHLPFDQIDKAYKGYRYAINLNSIKQSQSMFARRAFELLASNTITVSNFSRGMRLFFGDLVVTTDDGGEIVRRLEELGADALRERKFRLAGLRKAMGEHTYQDRFAYVVSKVRGRSVPPLLPRITVLGRARDARELRALVAAFERQIYQHKRLVVVTERKIARKDRPTGADVELVALDALGDDPVSTRIGPDERVAAMVSDDYYGPNHLLDLALATRYSDAPVIGRVSHFAWSDAGPTLVAPDQAYRTAPSAPARAALVRADVVGDAPLAEWTRELATRELTGTEVLAIDPFNYCRGGSVEGFSPALVDDVADWDLGIAMAELEARAERIAPESTESGGVPEIRGDRLASFFKGVREADVELEVVDRSLVVRSSLADGKHAYLYAPANLSPAELGWSDQARIHLDATPGVDVQLLLFFFDARKVRIGHALKTANRNHEADIPPGTEWIRFGLRVYGSGSGRIETLLLGHRPLQPGHVIGRARHLVLTNHYASYDDLYRNAFVHSRVLAYRRAGTPVDVFRLRLGEALSHHEFQGVDVLTGSQEALHQLLDAGDHESVLVHFLDASMWQVLQRHIDRIPVFVWLHGAEVQPWHRRAYNYETDAQREAAKAEGEPRFAFWQELLGAVPEHLKAVFVSRYFAEEVMEDLGFRIPEPHYTVIHNPIDVDRFRYVPKPPEQRRKLLSIRPYSSRQYANDQAVAAILALRDEPWFDELEIRMIGDGRLFDEVLEPLRDMKNVTLERRFLTHAEIAALHREYGLFLCPTRWDSHGVSRDEAMASGLVPVTNAIAAIPEFVDDRCGILAEPEDAAGLAAGIARLQEDPERFLAMSRAAAERVRRQTAAAHITGQELALFAGPSGAPRPKTGA